MCNKYEKFSRVNEYEKHDLVEKCNAIDFDFSGKVKHEQCLSCRNSCVDMEFNVTGTCIHYKKRMSLREINRETKEQNINIRKLCKKCNLKYYKMKDMLQNKMIMKFKYYIALENRILEREEYAKYMEVFDGEK